MKLSVKIAGIATAFAFALTAAAPSAGAQTVSELQALIAQLQAQLNALAGGTTSVPAFMYTRDLTLGSTGADVTALQTFLEARGTLVIPVGVSKGYFGVLTKTALAKYQASVAISPAVGYFGPITRAKVNIDSANGTTNPGSTNPGTTTPSNGLSGGEASLESFDLSSGDDSDVEEGASADIAEIEFDVEDGDVMIDRIDFALVGSTSTPTNEENDPWDAFDSITLSVDGKEIAEMDLSDEDDYLDEDDGTIRVSGINYKVEEGETVNIIVSLTAQNSVDGADADAAEWTINVETDGVRATDGDGIQQYIGSASDVVTFDIEAEGDGEELNVSTSSDDPESTTLKVEDDGKSDAYSIFAFDLESEESDIEIDTVEIEVETGTADVQDVVSEFTLEIDGEEFDDWSFVSGATASTSVISFDIDKDFTLDADSEVTVVLMAEFNAANGVNYATSGETISANILNAAISGEGADDVTSDGVAAGEEHDLAVAGIIVDESSIETTTKTQGDNDTTGIFTIEFDVTAFEEDFYIKESALLTGATNGVDFFIEGAATSTATSSATLASTADEDTDGVFTVREGETETFTVTVTLDVATTGQYRAGISNIFSTENSNGTTGNVNKSLDMTKFRTAYTNINAN